MLKREHGFLQNEEAAKYITPAELFARNGLFAQNGKMVWKNESSYLKKEDEMAYIYLFLFQVSLYPILLTFDSFPNKVIF